MCYLTLTFTGRLLCIVSHTQRTPEMIRSILDSQTKRGKPASGWRWEGLPCGSQDSCGACFYRCRLMRDGNKKPKVTTAPPQLSTSGRRGFKSTVVTSNRSIFHHSDGKDDPKIDKSVQVRVTGFHSTKYPTKPAGEASDTQVRMRPRIATWTRVCWL